ncbi:MAG: hypothetical protein WC810_23905 [Janthinobacterium sp.]|jgi:hypothetical protein
MDKPLALIIFKHTVNPKIPIFRDTYDCGWLSSGPYIIVWGNTKDKSTARKLMQDVLDKQGERAVIFYDREIFLKKSNSNIIELSNEEYQDIMNSAVKWN